jgi:hypothetical protein
MNNQDWRSTVPAEAVRVEHVMSMEMEKELEIFS